MLGQFVDQLAQLVTDFANTQAGVLGVCIVIALVCLKMMFMAR